MRASAVNALEVVCIICLVVDYAVKEGIAFENLTICADVTMDCSVICQVCFWLLVEKYRLLFGPPSSQHIVAATVALLHGSALSYRNYADTYDQS